MWKCDYCLREYDCGDRIENTAIRVGNKLIGLACTGKCTEEVQKRIASDIFYKDTVDMKA